LLKERRKKKTKRYQPTLCLGLRCVCGVFEVFGLLSPSRRKLFANKTLVWFISILPLDD
jgi:hypothetical protein